jgi:hypothetical protein
MDMVRIAEIVGFFGIFHLGVDGAGIRVAEATTT